MTSHDVAETGQQSCGVGTHTSTRVQGAGADGQIFHLPGPGKVQYHAVHLTLNGDVHNTAWKVCLIFLSFVRTLGVRTHSHTSLESLTLRSLSNDPTTWGCMCVCERVDGVCPTFDPLN